MAKLEIIKNMIDKNTGTPYLEGSTMFVADEKRIDELVKAGVAKVAKGPAKIEK